MYACRGANAFTQHKRHTAVYAMKTHKHVTGTFGVGGEKEREGNSQAGRGGMHDRNATTEQTLTIHNRVWIEFVEERKHTEA